jgi:arylsulfatase A-like enzyme
MRRLLHFGLTLLAISFISIDKNFADDKFPNIVIIYADDLGYGDVSCYNSKSKINTPHIDQLAKQGMRFTDAHSSATVCTPSRYSLLTGRMAFRARGEGRVFDGVGGPNLIEPNRLSLAQMLKDKGYATACFGKWHVGMTFYDKDGKPINQGGMKGVERIDFSRQITGAPIHRGFDHFFGTASCPTTDWLYAYIDGDKVPIPPTGLLDKRGLPKHDYSRDNRRGLIAPGYDLEKVDLVFLKKSQKFLENHVKQSPDKPFFLYHATQAVHLPSFPAGQFKGKTKAGPHGDFIFELDYIVGELMSTLEKLGVADDTLVIFSSDNGPEVGPVFHMRKNFDHDGARPWRGMKRDNWEAGHRVPFIVRWPGKVKPDSISGQVFCQTDVMATLAAIVETNLPNAAAEDSFDFLPVLLGKSEKPIREYVIHQGFAGSRKLAIRRGPWKYLNHQGSGGNNYERNRLLKAFILPEAAPDAVGQLYDLQNDPGETKNLYHEYPQIVKELDSQLDEFVTSGRSAPIRK